MKTQKTSGEKPAPKAGVIVDDVDRGNNMSIPEKPSRKKIRGTGAAIRGTTFGKDG